jgi:hypothetical protein
MRFQRPVILSVEVRLLTSSSSLRERAVDFGDGLELDFLGLGEEILDFLAAGERVEGVRAVGGQPHEAVRGGPPAGGGDARRTLLERFADEPVVVVPVGAGRDLAGDCDQAS